MNLRTQKKIIAEGSDDRILFMDFEQALDEDYARALGLDIDHKSFVIARPRELEQGCNLALKLIATGKVRLSIWDSVAAMVPHDIRVGDMEKNTIALQARELAKFFNKAVPLFAQTGCVGIFLNHEKDVISLNPMSAPSTTTPGGKALKFYSSIRIQFKQAGNQRRQGVNPVTGEKSLLVVSTDVKVKVVKNKVSAPFKEAMVRSYFGHGYSNFMSAMTVLVNKKIVANSAGYFYFDKGAASLAHPAMAVSGTGRPNIRGDENVMKFSEDHPEWADKVVDLARSVLGAKIETTDDESDDSEEEPSRYSLNGD